MINATYKVTSEPASEPVTLQSLKSALRMTTCDFDEELLRIITVARRKVENDARVMLVTQTVVMYADKFPVGDILELRKPPVQSITSVAYTDTAGDAQTFASSNYNTDLISAPCRIQLVAGSSWPATEDSPHAVQVTYVAGYGAASVVPTEARMAIIQWAKMVWKGCESDSSERNIYDNLINLVAWTAIGMEQ